MHERAALMTAFALLGIAGASTIMAGAASTGFFCELEITAPALARSAPVVAPVRGARPARRVVLVIVDGLRARDAHDLPALDGLRRVGTAGTAASHYPTWSRPNYASILTGVPPEASGVRTNQHAGTVALDSVMDRTQAGGLTCALVSDYEALPQMFLRRADDGTYRSPCDTARYAPWAGGSAETADAIATGDAALSVLLIGGVDLAGHLHGAASEAYRSAAREADRTLAQVLARVDLARDAVIVTADHGHIDRGGHGGNERDVIEVPLVAAGAGIRRAARVNAARLIDIAPTIAALLGLPAPGHGLGRTLVELLDLAPEELRARADADRARLAINQQVVDAERERAHRALTVRRRIRGMLALALALLVIAAGVVLARRGALRLDRRAQVIAILTCAVSYAAARVLATDSVSTLPSQSQLVPVLVGGGILALVLHLSACAWAVRHHREPIAQLAAANAIAGLALGVALVPAGIAWVAYSPPHRVLPDAGWIAHIPVVFAGVACTSIAVAAGLTGSLFAFVACRHNHSERTEGIGSRRAVR